jgi:hypothetical protein
VNSVWLRRSSGPAWLSVQRSVSAGDDRLVFRVILRQLGQHAERLRTLARKNEGQLRIRLLVCVLLLVGV